MIKFNLSFLKMKIDFLFKEFLENKNNLIFRELILLYFHIVKNAKGIKYSKKMLKNRRFYPKKMLEKINRNNIN